MGEAKRRQLETEAQLKPGLPPLPPAMRSLPIDARGFPVPWFVAWLSDDRARELRPGFGTPDFRCIGGDRIGRAVRGQLCWLCGKPLGRLACCVIGPMCAVNRISSEPPSHPDCARFAVKACPFLTRPQMRRRKGGLEELEDNAPGVPIDRNPGVTLLWFTNVVRFSPSSRLFDVGEPVSWEWWTQGRLATRAEALETLETGLPLLQEIADREGAEAQAFLVEKTEVAFAMLPPA